MSTEFDDISLSMYKWIKIQNRIAKTNIIEQIIKKYEIQPMPKLISKVNHLIISHL